MPRTHLHPHAVNIRSKHLKQMTKVELLTHEARHIPLGGLPDGQAVTIPKYPVPMLLIRPPTSLPQGLFLRPQPPHVVKTWRTLRVPRR